MAGTTRHSPNLVFPPGQPTDQPTQVALNRTSRYPQALTLDVVLFFFAV